MEDDTPAAGSVGVFIGPLSSFHDGKIILNFVCTTVTLARLMRDYQIPDTIIISLPHRGYDVYTPSLGLLLIHVAVFECGVRLPLHPTLRRAFVALELAPLQTSLGFWKHLTRFLVF